MRRRWLYVLIFSLPALLAAVIVSVVATGSAAGALWLFVFGDDPWPAAASAGLVILFALTCAGSWLAFLAIAYAAGRRNEGGAGTSGKALAISAGATAALIALAMLHQWRVGNLGPPSSEMVCSEFCRARGFAASGMPPRNSNSDACSCFDAQGREAVKV